MKVNQAEMESIRLAANKRGLPVASFARWSTLSKAAEVPIKSLEGLRQAAEEGENAR